MLFSLDIFLSSPLTASFKASIACRYWFFSCIDLSLILSVTFHSMNHTIRMVTGMDQFSNLRSPRMTSASLIIAFDFFIRQTAGSLNTMDCFLPVALSLATRSKYVSVNIEDTSICGMPGRWRMSANQTSNDYSRAFLTLTCRT